ncbi:MAG: MGMT family protein [Lentisphaeria bacterium]
MITKFQQRVYAAVRRIPRGRVTTYKALVEYLGCGSCQAVGQALRHNSHAPVVPCHRVIASDLTIGGFAGRRSGPEVARKLRLLATEGVEFRNGRLADPLRCISALKPTTEGNP